MKSFLRNNYIEVYSAQNKGQSAIAKRFIRTLKKKKLCNYITSMPKKVCIYKLDDIVNKYNNTYHSTIKIKAVGINSNTYINSSKEVRNKDPKLKIGVSDRILKYKNIFAKDYTQSVKKSPKSCLVDIYC